MAIFRTITRLQNPGAPRPQYLPNLPTYLAKADIREVSILSSSRLIRKDDFPQRSDLRLLKSEAGLEVRATLAPALPTRALPSLRRDPFPFYEQYGVLRLYEFPEYLFGIHRGLRAFVRPGALDRPRLLTYPGAYGLFEPRGPWHFESPETAADLRLRATLRLPTSVLLSDPLGPRLQDLLREADELTWHPHHVVIRYELGSA